MVNSIKKGHNFELRVAKILTKAFGVQFRRVPMSGAMQTAQNTSDFRFKGDIFTESFEFNDLKKVVIECKKTKDSVSLLEYLKWELSCKGRIRDWIEQCKRECESAPNVGFWLIFSSNNQPPLIIEGERLNDGWHICEPAIFEEWLKEEERP